MVATNQEKERVGRGENSFMRFSLRILNIYVFFRNLNNV